MDLRTSKQGFISKILHEINMRLWWKLCKIRD